MPDNPLDLFGGTFQDAESLKNWLLTNVSFEFFAEGSGDTQWAFFHELGLPITRSEYRDIRRNVLGYEFHQRDILSLADEEVIPTQYFYAKHGLQLSGEYLYKFDVELYDVTTGEHISGTRAMIGHDEYSVGELKDMMTEKLERPGATSEVIVVSINLKGALINPG